MALKVDANYVDKPVTNSFAPMMRELASMEKSKLETEIQKRTRAQTMAGTDPGVANVVAESQTPEASPVTYGNVLNGKYAITQKFNNYNPALYSGITADSRHKGLDVATPLNTPIYAPSEGKVSYGTDKNYGNYAIVTTADGTTYRFSHLTGVDDLIKKAAQAEQMIQTGQRLGFTGSTGNSTGPHLDISVMQNGKFVDPLSMEAIRRSL